MFTRADSRTNSREVLGKFEQGGSTPLRAFSVPEPRFGTADAFGRRRESNVSCFLGHCGENGSTSNEYVLSIPHPLFAASI